MDYNFGKVVEKLLEEKRQTKKSLYDYLKMTGNGFDAMMKNNTFTAVRLAQIADFFEVEITELYGKTAQVQKATFGEETLQKVMQEMKQELKQELKQEFSEQLRIKDRQIEKLIDLLGKPEGAIIEPTSTEYKHFEETMNLYVSYVSTHMGVDLSHVKTFSKSVAEQKLVAPRSLMQRISAMD